MFPPSRIMKPLRPLAWTLAAVAVVTRTGCRGSGKVRVAFVSNNPEAFWSIAEVGAQKAADEAGVELVFQKPPASDVGEQKKKIDQVVNRGVKGVAVSVI